MKCFVYVIYNVFTLSNIPYTLYLSHLIYENVMRKVEWMLIWCSFQVVFIIFFFLSHTSSSYVCMCVNVSFVCIVVALLQTWECWLVTVGRYSPPPSTRTTHSSCLHLKMELVRNSQINRTQSSALMLGDVCYISHISACICLETQQQQQSHQQSQICVILLEICLS